MLSIAGSKNKMSDRIPRKNIQFKVFFLRVRLEDLCWETPVGSAPNRFYKLTLLSWSMSHFHISSS